MARKFEGISTASQVRKRLEEQRDAEKAAFYPKFFRTGPGEYGEGDQFLGVVVPKQRKIAKASRRLPLEEVQKLLHSPYHECRLTGLFVLVHQFDDAKNDEGQKQIFQFYIRNVDRVNNWDLVDTTCHKIIGPYLFEKDRKLLFQFAKARHLWKNRISIVSTYYFIKRQDLGTTLEIASLLIRHPHDLIHKAVGWMLRELGKQDKDLLVQFLNQYKNRMPRTMLRYAIEKFDKSTRQKFLDRS